MQRTLLVTEFAPACNTSRLEWIVRARHRENHASSFASCFAALHSAQRDVPRECIGESGALRRLTTCALHRCIHLRASTRCKILGSPLVPGNLLFSDARKKSRSESSHPLPRPRNSCSQVVYRREPQTSRRKDRSHARLRLPIGRFSAGVNGAIVSSLKLLAREL